MMNAPTPTPPDLAAAREHFLTLVDTLRPDLHRYAARLVGSAIDGEDVVQDTLAKAFYALSLSPELPRLRPWLFRIARNTALDFLRRYERTHAEPLPDHDVMPEPDPAPDPEALRAALASFMTLPPSQRSAVILKDVLGESLDDIATHLGTTVQAVKALLVRGRQRLRTLAEATPAALPREAERVPDAPPDAPQHTALVRQYVSLFNARDWPGVQALLLEECRLDLVAKSQRQGKAVGAYFARYAQEPDVRLIAGRCEGRTCLGVMRGAAATPASIILIESEGGRVSFIRDFRYVPYLAAELVFVAD